MLKGIGPKKAEEIILYRQQHGNFSRIEDLENVKGVSKRLLNNLSEDLSISGKTDISNLKSSSKKQISKMVEQTTNDSKKKFRSEGNNRSVINKQSNVITSDEVVKSKKKNLSDALDMKKEAPTETIGKQDIRKKRRN